MNQSRNLENWVSKHFLNLQVTFPERRKGMKVLQLGII